MLATCFSTAPSDITSCGGDGRVGSTFRHEGEHLPLPGAQHRDRVGVPGGPQELGHHFGVERRAAGRHPHQGFDEVAHVGHPILEQIADPGRIVGQQLGRVTGLDVLGEQQDARALVVSAQLDGGAQPSSVKVGGMRMSMTATSGRSCSMDRRRASAFTDGTGDAESPIDQQLDQSVPQDDRVLGDDDPKRCAHSDVQREVHGDHRRPIRRAHDAQATVDGVHTVGEAGQPTRGRAEA